MTATAESDVPDAGSAVLHTWRVLLDDVAAQLRELGAHPARSVVLLPYAQLMPLAARLWAEQFPDSFAPRFETTRNWAARVGTFEPGANDLSFEHGRDLLTAASLLEGAGLGAQRELLAGPLVELASQLGQMAASVPAGMRPQWAAHARQALPPLGDGPLALEAALGRIGVAWAASSDYVTDVLFTPRVSDGLDALLIVEGLQTDPLSSSLADHYFERTVTLQARPDAGAGVGQIALHSCADGEDEAERAAACVLHHLAEGRAPVALCAGDRVLTRRISALLAARGVALRDETGWKLSTSHAAAQLQALLRACAPRAPSDAVLDALKLSPAVQPAALQRLERALRRYAVRSWAQAGAVAPDEALLTQIEAWRAPMAGRQTLGDWLTRTRSLLEAAGIWPSLAHDAAGAALIDALGLGAAALERWRQWPSAQRRMGLSEFTRWVADTLEAASFRPPSAPHAQVVILPMSQLLGRPLAALVLPGADERRLPSMPEPPGAWSATQRQVLHLPSRQALHAAQQAAWEVALRVPRVDILWRSSDDSGEPLAPSPWVQSLQIHPAAGAPPGIALVDGADPRVRRALTPAPVTRPAPGAAALAPQRLTASSYDMLRACPYRFFALQQLALRPEGELDVDVDKRAWGNWVHTALGHFHEALRREPAADRLALMDAAAAQATRELALGLHEGEFMPFSVAWPGLRDAYLAWFAAYETTGAVFESAETTLRAEAEGLALFGRLDRIDRQRDGAPMLIDYKTESAQRSKDRVAAGNEDTQLPFYALLSGAAAPRAAYLNLAERETPKLYELAQLPALADQLLAGMRADMARIAAGAPLPALGEGSVCDWCDARGLCRKDFWS